MAAKGRIRNTTDGANERVTIKESESHLLTTAFTPELIKSFPCLLETSMWLIVIDSG